MKTFQTFLFVLFLLAALFSFWACLLHGNIIGLIIVALAWVGLLRLNLKIK